MSSLRNEPRGTVSFSSMFVLVAMTAIAVLLLLNSQSTDAIRIQSWETTKNSKRSSPSSPYTLITTGNLIDYTGRYRYFPSPTDPSTSLEIIELSLRN